MFEAGYSLACSEIIWQPVPFTDRLVDEAGLRSACIALWYNKIISMAIAGRIIMKV